LKIFSLAVPCHPPEACGTRITKQFASAYIKVPNVSHKLPASCKPRGVAGWVIIGLPVFSWAQFPRWASFASVARPRIIDGFLAITVLSGGVTS
jgi:hypothetical protein